MQNSKTNTVLLVVVIVLLGVGLWFMMSKKENPSNDESGTRPVGFTQTTDNANGPDYQPGKVQPTLTTPTLISGDVANFVSFSIAPGATVSGVTHATGSLKGGYFSEGNMGVKILSANKAVLKSGHGTATTDWMTSGPVSFTTTLDFVGIPSGTGFIRLQNDNPSGDPAKDKYIDIPVVFQ